MADDRQTASRPDGAGAGSLDAWLAEASGDLESGVLTPRVFNDPELHELELNEIFNKCWVFVGHVSEIPDPGDYALRYIGEDQFILARDEDGDIQVMLNNCMHRASPVCRAEKGNASHFRCPYHGWIYKNNGEWNGAPFRARAYRKLDASAWGLRKAPHVDAYQGLIFANLDEGAPPLAEYLGDMCWYLDVLFGASEEGMQVVGDPQRWVIPANWKSGAENFAGDAYHVPHLHRSGEEVGVFPQIDRAVELQFQVALEGGHGLIGNRGNLPEPFGIFDCPPDVAGIFDLNGLNEDQRTFLRNRNAVTVFTIFPNLSFIRAPGVYDPSRPPATFTCLRQWQPKGPGELELWNWPLVWNAAPAEFNEASYNASVLQFSPSGIFEQDDTVAWSGGPPAGRSPFARREMKLNFELGLGEMSDFEIATDWIGPGTAFTTAFGERNQRGWWQRWCGELR